jgi:hypothetical protein
MGYSLEHDEFLAKLQASAGDDEAIKMLLEKRAQEQMLLEDMKRRGGMLGRVRSAPVVPRGALMPGVYGVPVGIMGGRRG